MDNITIRDIKVFVTAPRGINLVIVKVETSEPELFGYGCATLHGGTRLWLQPSRNISALC